VARKLWKSNPSHWVKVVNSDPFLSLIIGEIQERSQFSMGTASEFSLSVKEYDISTLTADITTPSGRAEPCILKKLPNGHLGKLVMIKKTDPTEQVNGGDKEGTRAHLVPAWASTKSPGKPERGSERALRPSLGIILLTLKKIVVGRIRCSGLVISSH